MVTVWLLVYFFVDVNGKYDERTLRTFASEEECVEVLKTTTAKGLDCVGILSATENPVTEYKSRLWF